MTFNQIADRFAQAANVRFCEDCDAVIPTYKRLCISCEAMVRADELAALEPNPRPEQMS